MNRLSPAHACDATLLVSDAEARAMGLLAQRINDGLEYRREAAMVKAWCSDVYPKSCLLAHQIFGANGFTEEYDLHLYTKHAKVSELMFGHSVFHRSAVADAMKI